MSSPRTTRTLAVRSDSIGDVLLTEPALRAIAASSALTLLCSPHGRPAVDVMRTAPAAMVYDAPWIAADPPPLDPAQVDVLVHRIRAGRFDQAVIFTSDRQSALPMAFVLRLAGIPRIGAHSDHYPGSLLDVRVRRSEPSAATPVHEVVRNLGLVEAMGFTPPDDRRVLLRDVDPSRMAPAVQGLIDEPGYVVVHPGAMAPARTARAERWVGAALALLEAGHRVVVTGPAGDARAAAVTAAVPGVTDLVGATTLPELVTVLERAAAVCVGNTGVMHLAAAAGTPVVAVFPATVPLARWRPWQVEHVVLGDQHVACAPCYQRVCPLPAHPCGALDPAAVVAAVAHLVRRRLPAAWPEGAVGVGA